MTFREIVKNLLIQAANEYKKILKYDYHIKSNVFLYQNEYVLRFNEDNFLHLTGIKTKLKAKEFYRKCLSRNLDDDEFDCDSSNELKKKVKRKLKYLVVFGDFFDRKLIFQEHFIENRIQCKIASSDTRCTIGFINVKDSVCVPLTLLNRNQINPEFEIVDFVIVKKRKK